MVREGDVLRLQGGLTDENKLLLSQASLEVKMLVESYVCGVLRLHLGDGPAVRGAHHDDAVPQHKRISLDGARGISRQP